MRFLILSLIVAVVCLAGVRGDDKSWPPRAYPESRYEESWSRNPFNLKTAPVVENKTSFAANLAIAGISVVGDQKAVILVDRTTRQYQRVTPEPNAAGISLISISQEDGLTSAMAEIAKDGEKAVVRYQAIAPRKGSGKGRPKESGAGRPGEPNPSDGRSRSEPSNGR